MNDRGFSERLIVRTKHQERWKPLDVGALSRRRTISQGSCRRRWFVCFSDKLLFIRLIFLQLSFALPSTTSKLFIHLAELPIRPLSSFLSFMKPIHLLLYLPYLSISPSKPCHLSRDRSRSDLVDEVHAGTCWTNDSRC